MPWVRVVIIALPALQERIIDHMVMWVTDNMLVVAFLSKHGGGTTAIFGNRHNRSFNERSFPVIGPQGFHSSPPKRKVILISPLVLWTEPLSMQGHSSVFRRFRGSKRKKWMCQNTISFWIRSVFNHAYASASEEDCRYVESGFTKSRRFPCHFC